MRHDWTLLCTEVQANEIGSISLGNIFSSLRITSPFGSVKSVESLLFDPPAILMSHWTAEFESERRVHTGRVQLMAPGGERVLWADDIVIDFRIQATQRLIYILQDMHLAGIGTYEYHVFLAGYDTINEWGRACLTISDQ